MIIKEIDFKLFKSKAEDKIFRFTNTDGTVYDMTSSTAECKFYKDPTSPTVISCDIAVSTGRITIPFLAGHADTLGNFEYIIEEDVGGGGTILPLVKGNISVLKYTPFSETIAGYLKSELPANLELTPDYKNQRLFYWRRILQSAFNIADANLNIESAWPILVNALFAKLIVYDSLELAIKGSFIQFLGGDYTDTTTIGGGGLKSVQTGPTKAEYYDTAASAKNAFVSSAGNISMFDSLKESICGLTNYLGVKVPMCKGVDIYITPKFHQNPDWDYPTLDDMDDSIQGEVSQG